MKKALLILMLLLCCLAMTACYTDADPWVKEYAPLQPLTTVPPELLPKPSEEVPSPDAPVTLPPVTAEPIPENSVDASPNFNG